MDINNVDILFYTRTTYDGEETVESCFDRVIKKIALWGHDFLPKDTLILCGYPSSLSSKPMDIYDVAVENLRSYIREHQIAFRVITNNTIVAAIRRPSNGILEVLWMKTRLPFSYE